MGSDPGKKRVDLKRVHLFGGVGENDFLQVVRRLECSQSNKPRVGFAKRPTEEYVRFHQSPRLVFEESSVRKKTGDEVTSLLCQFIGLLGTNGPLPAHYTEYARERIELAGDDTFLAFLNVFNHRFLSLFYRAWASGEPAIQLDRPKDDAFSGYLTSIGGFGATGERTYTSKQEKARVYFTGFYSLNSRTAEGLEKILSFLTGCIVKVSDFIGAWHPVPSSEQACLGTGARTSSLGRGALLGQFHWDAQSSVEIQLCQCSLDIYRSIATGGDMYGVVKSAVRDYLGLGFRCKIKVHLEYSEALKAETKLGRQEAHLGVTSSLKSEAGGSPVEMSISRSF